MIRIIILFLLSPILLRAQLSPGELFKGHAHLEGNLNCTKCHTIGQKVSDDKCLQCHGEIKKRIDQKKGYHASSEVKSKSCIQCHSDHHGKNFQIIRFDQKKFNHASTGYNLTGKHTALECKACHHQSFIVDPTLKNKQSSFLGLDEQCKTCHKDIHHGTLSDKCATCHTTQQFIPASLFEHSKTKFPLLGKHQHIDCKACHTNRLESNQQKVVFELKAFQQCNACHQNPHARSVQSCNDCHTEETFSKFSGGKKFNHNRTGFPLKGKHKHIACNACHQLQQPLVHLFQDHSERKQLECVDCHKDVHAGRFGIDCKQCHSEEGFTLNRNINQFDHGLTAFPLQGKHLGVDCKKCHRNNLTEPVPHQLCASCHKDAHEVVYKNPQLPTDCKDCHQVAGFQGSLYQLEDHALSKFPLTGAHQATPCIQCHFNEQKWTFRIPDQRCFHCHQDPHQGYLPERHYPGKTCQNCHQTESWQSIDFDHTKTQFPLLGKHAQTRCDQCHRKKEDNEGRNPIIFVALEQECIHCHEDIHQGQFNDGQHFTDCKKCHGLESWRAIHFDHSKTAFKLDGKHAEIACNACHHEYLDENKKYLKFKLDKFQCADCHR